MASTSKKGSRLKKAFYVPSAADKRARARRDVEFEKERQEGLERLRRYNESDERKKDIERFKAFQKFIEDNDIPEILGNLNKRRR